MIKIEITDPTNTPANELRAVAQCLITIADGVDTPRKAVDVLVEVCARPPVTPITEEIRATLDEKIKAFDLPDVGLPVGEALREPTIDPRAVFGTVPNVPAVPAFSIAVAAALPTVPAVPQAISTPAASVPLPPVPPVPGVDAQPDEGVASDAQFDSTGLPWDARIHSRGRSMNANGTWRSKRGVDDATVEQVVAELRAVPGVPSTTLADDVATAEASWPFKEHSAAVPPPPPVAIVSFPAFMGKYVPLVSAGKITQEQITAILVGHGIPSLPLLSARTDLLPTIAAQLDAIVAP